MYLTLNKLSYLILVAMLLSEISRSIGLFSEQATLRPECLFTIIMSLKRKRSVLSIKVKQAIILRLEKKGKRNQFVS